MKSDEDVISISSLCKIYQMGDFCIEALKDVNLKVGKGEFVVLSGPQDRERRHF
ncbi:MAG: hypothetical protein ACUVUE_06740 [Candidatus Bathycorpusculaceae bacterium]